MDDSWCGHDVDPAGHAVCAIVLSIDVEQRMASLKIDDLVESRGTPIISPHTGEPTRSRINMPDGIHYIFAEIGNGNTTARAGVELELTHDVVSGSFSVFVHVQNVELAVAVLHDGRRVDPGWRGEFGPVMPTRSTPFSRVGTTSWS